METRMSAPESTTVLTFAGFRLDPGKRRLIGPDGGPVNLSARAFDTLHYLALHPHEVVDKNRLMEAVWPNSVVEENNLHQQISTLRRVLGEAAGDHQFIVTDSGRGYRFVQDVERATPSPAAASGPAPGLPPAFPRRSWHPFWNGALFTAAAVLLMVTAYHLLARRQSVATATREPPSIAVLPFADLSPDHDQGYFVDGLSEELLGALGRLNGLRVIGRTSSFSFKDRNVSVRDAAAALGVQHVLEGSVRRDGDRLRISAQLVDPANGSQLWARTYDRESGDVFAIQRQIADSVAATLQLTLQAPQDAAASGGTRNIEAYEAYLAAHALINNVGSTQAPDAIRLLEHAVQLDPEFAQGWAALAESYTFAADFPPNLALQLTPVELQQHMSRAALRALELAPDSPQSLRSAGMVSMRNRDWADADRLLRRAVELAGPYDYDSNLQYAGFLMNVGRATEAIRYEERAMRAEPLLLRPVTLRAALYEMSGELDKAEAMLLASNALTGQEAMRRQGLIMIGLARHDRNGVMRLGNQGSNTQPCLILADPPRALTELRGDYQEATRTGANGQLMPVALYASLLGDQALALDAIRVLGPTTQSLFTIWRPALSDVRRHPGFEQFVRDVGLVDYWRASGEWGDFCRQTPGGAVVCR
jgi:TolB-like protein/DNA-binding winged helix-turn-helix (wHTH) protein